VLNRWIPDESEAREICQEPAVGSFLMRLFVALDIADDIRERIARFLDGVCEFAPEARWVRPESLHVTLKFIGEKPDTFLGELQKMLSTVEAPAIQMNFRGSGFFPNAKAPRVFWVGVEAGAHLSALATAVDERVSQLGVSKEAHVYSPHLTLARAGGSGSPHWQKSDKHNQAFQRLQQKLAALSSLEFGTMTAHEFFLYQSQLGRDGSKYRKLSAFALH
jgi:RNA 2',3'-cyclic 3'-phosphodiesterase